MNDNNDSKRWLIWPIIFGVLTLGVLALGALTTWMDYDAAVQTVVGGDDVEKIWANRGSRGDFWGGHLAATGTLAAVFLLVVGILVQRRELIEARAAAQQQARALEQANKFAAITTIHRTMANRQAYEIRGYLHETFPEVLAQVVEKLAQERNGNWKACLAGDRVNVASVLKAWTTPNSEERTEFNKELKAAQGLSFEGREITPLQAVEWSLMDWDIIALPHSRMELESAQALVEAYGIVLARMAKVVLPFVAIHLKLRGGEDPRYKEHYIKMLLEIDEPDIKKDVELLRDEIQAQTAAPPASTAKP